MRKSEQRLLRTSTDEQFSKLGPKFAGLFKTALSTMSPAAAAGVASDGLFFALGEEGYKTFFDHKFGELIEEGTWAECMGGARQRHGDEELSAAEFPPIFEDAGARTQVRQLNGIIQYIVFLGGSLSTRQTALLGYAQDYGLSVGVETFLGQIILVIRKMPRVQDSEDVLTHLIGKREPTRPPGR